ncbi:Tn3 family transposase [Streptomyces sp. CA-179760]|uniref:Tn3 family transposase n=1 Tax=Streptomyces sp. CA-179760 TaxID=3240054 RepID=UPI003D940665
MPVEFLTDEQAEAYGKFAEEPTRPELERFFFLGDVDRDLIARRRSTHHQLGFALQMCTVRYIGRFLPDNPLDAPWPVVEHLAAQLGIEDPSVVKRWIAKTEHLLRVVDPVDDTYRRQMNRQLTVQESRHKLARDVCHGKRGTIHQAYRDGMEDQLGALGLVLNAIVLWTTKYIDAAVAQLQAEGHEIREEDIARLSPLKHRNLNLLGRYSFTPSTPRQGLRPLRDPDAPELDEDDDGQE